MCWYQGTRDGATVSEGLVPCDVQGNRGSRFSRRTMFWHSCFVTPGVRVPFERYAKALMHAQPADVARPQSAETFGEVFGRGIVMYVSQRYPMM